MDKGSKTAIWITIGVSFIVGAFTHEINFPPTDSVLSNIGGYIGGSLGIALVILIFPLISSFIFYLIRGWPNGYFKASTYLLLVLISLMLIIGLKAYSVAS